MSHTMHNPAYLMLSRHRVYYFRWPIPRHLCPNQPLQHVRLSLGTRQPREALHLARVLEYHAALLISRYGPDLMNHSEIKAIVHEYCQRVLEERKRQIMVNGPLTPEMVAFYKRSIEDAAIVKELEDSGIKIDDSGVLALLEDQALDIGPGSSDYELFRSNYRLAAPAFSRELLRFNEEQIGFDFTPTIPPHTASNGHKASNRHTLEAIIDKFIKMYTQDKRWSPRTEKEKRAHYSTLQEIIGSKFIITDMDAEIARHVRDTVQAMPMNRSKDPKVRDLPLMEAVKVQDVQRVSPATSKKYLESYNALFAWCVDEGYTEKNNFQTLRGRVPKENNAPRMAFSPDSIKLICAEVDKGPEGIANKDYRYWGTIIGVYTGARLNEIAQITLDDLKQEDGVWYFDMNDDGDKKLKNKASRRRVPIHDALLNRGIIEYRDRLKKRGETHLLYELPLSKLGERGRNLSHFFNQVLLRKLGLKKKEVVFHCLRHTVNTRLRQAGVELTMVQTIIGHKRAGGASETYFNEGFKLPDLKAALDKLPTL